MIKKETYIFTSIITVLFVLAFSLLYFLVPFPIKDVACHAVNYSLTILLSIVFVILFLFGMNKRKNIEGLVFRLPLVNLVVTFEIVNVILSVIQVVVNAFVSVPFYVPVIVYIFETIIFVSLFLLKKQNIRHIENTEDTIHDSIHNIKELRTKSLSLLHICKDDVSKNNISIIIDKLKYSDPVSNDKTKDIEAKIFEKLTEIENKLYDGLSISSADDVISLIESRNVLCKGNK